MALQWLNGVLCFVINTVLAHSLRPPKTLISYSDKSLAESALRL